MGLFGNKKQQDDTNEYVRGIFNLYKKLEADIGLLHAEMFGLTTCVIELEKMVDDLGEVNLNLALHKAEPRLVQPSLGTQLEIEFKEPEMVVETKSKIKPTKKKQEKYKRHTFAETRRALWRIYSEMRKSGKDMTLRQIKDLVPNDFSDASVYYLLQKMMAKDFLRRVDSRETNGSQYVYYAVKGYTKEEICSIVGHGP